MSEVEVTRRRGRPRKDEMPVASVEHGENGEKEFPKKAALSQDGWVCETHPLSKVYRSNIKKCQVCSGDLIEMGEWKKMDAMIRKMEKSRMQ